MLYGYVITVIILRRTKMQEKRLRLKITCLTPKGKAKKASKEWRKQFPTFKKPVEQKIINDSKFYWIYEFKKEKDMYHFQKKTVLAAIGIKRFYYMIMGASKKANKMKKKCNWGLEKARKWALKRINKNITDADKKIDDFRDIINMEDEKDMRKFLKKDIITYKFLGDANESKD